MVRRRILIEKIQDQKSRSVTFHKRKQGLLKKATELSILCEADLVISIKFNDQFYRFSSKKGEFEAMCQEACQVTKCSEQIVQESHNEDIMANLRQKELKEKEIQDCQQVYKRKKDELVLDSDNDSENSSRRKKRRQLSEKKNDEPMESEYIENNGKIMDSESRANLGIHFLTVQNSQVGDSGSSIHPVHRRMNMPPPTTVNSALPPPIIGGEQMRVYQRTPPVLLSHHSNMNPGFSPLPQYASPSLVRQSHFGSHESPPITHSHFSTENKNQTLGPFSGSTGGLGLKNDKQFYQSLSSQSLQSIENVNATYKHGVNSFGTSISIHPLSSSNQSSSPSNYSSLIPRSIGQSSIFPVSEEEPQLSIHIPQDNELKHPGPPVGYSPELSSQVNSTTNSNSPLGSRHAEPSDSPLDLPSPT